MIDQATGILVVQQRCSAEQAHGLLTAAAGRNRLEVAADLVGRAGRGELS